MSILNKKLFTGFAYGCWGVVGIYRGIRQYNFENNKQTIFYNYQLKRYKKEEEIPSYLLKPTYFYMTSAAYGAFGLTMYLFPFTAPICFVKEIYRAEISLRNIDHEKDSKFYNNVLY